MKKPLTITFLTFLLAITSFAQTSTDKNVEIKYDKFKDRTTVSLKLPIVNNPLQSEELYLGMTSAFNGNKPTSIPDSVYSFFLSVTKTKQYSLSHSWIVLADEERIRLGDGQYLGEGGELKAAEVIIYSLSSENLKKIASAKKVEMQLGSKEFALTDSQLASLKEFYKQLVP